MYTCRDGWPTCRCIQGLRTFVWTVLPPDSQRRFDWIDSIHLFPTASSLSLARTLGSPLRRRLRPAVAATTTTEGGGVDRGYCCSFPAPSAERRWHPQLPVQVLARLVVSHGSIAPNARSRSLGERARLAICITVAPTISR